ncbi:hypothetical protein ACPPVU_13905 [Mucilaginibacter sp. McL0603]|uniref:hypothetical protein n=1 Tax=Mucilaginibacter sp. McL0603 TaxID=3415670 RepID=UPI003CF2812B
MNSTVELIFTVVGAALVLLTVYGAIKLDRKLFLSGLCFFSILPLFGESMGYNADKAPIHVLVIFVFVIQFILALPNKIVYGPDNLAATKLATKIALALLVINAVGAVFIFCLNAGVAVQFGYFHVVFSVAIVYLLIKRSSTNAWLK